MTASVRTPSVSLVLIIWLASVVSLCIWGSEKFTPAGLSALSFFIAAYIVALWAVQIGHAVDEVPSTMKRAVVAISSNQ